MSPSGLFFLLPLFPVVYTTGREMPPSGLKTALHRGCIPIR
jgi:hypothetical protein